MKVLLINPPDDLIAFLGAGADLITPFEPLGLLYIAAVLQESGYAVQVIDAYVEKISLDELQERIKRADPDIIGITVFTSNGNQVYDLGKWIKKTLPQKFVVLGNVHAAVYAEQYLREGCCDAVIHGEGEYVFLDLVKMIEAGNRNFRELGAVSYIRDGRFIQNTEEGVIEDLSSLPLPARDLVDQKFYNIPSVSNLPYSGKKDSVGKHMFTSRGCPNRCTFCTVHHSRRQRFSDVEHVVDEMELLVTKYKADYIFIMDSLFIGKKSRVHAICDEIKSRKLEFKWGCEAHVRFIDRDLVRAMDSAGCHDMAFGIESGVQRLLDNVHKNNTLQQVVDAVATVKGESDIKVSGLFILGLPGETYQDSLRTINFAKSLPLDMAQFSILVPYPGSAIYDELKDRGELDTGILPDGRLDPSVWLRYSSYISYTENEPIWVTPALTSDQLKQLQKKALRSFYFRPRHFLAQVKRLRPRDIPRMWRTAIETFF